MAELQVPITPYYGPNTMVSLPVADGITDLNITDLVTNLDLVVEGNIGQAVLVTEVDKDNGPGGPAASKKAQREIKWLVTFAETAVPSNEAQLEIPCADLALLIANSNQMDVGAGAGSTFKNTFELHAVHPDNEGAVTLISVVSIGKNL